MKIFDHKENLYLALKIIRNKRKFHYQAAVEVKVLQYCKDNDPSDMANIVKMKDFFIFRKHLVYICYIDLYIYI